MSPGSSECYTTDQHNPEHHTTPLVGIVEKDRKPCKGPIKNIRKFCAPRNIDGGVVPRDSHDTRSPGWKVAVDGQEVDPPPRSVILGNEKIGTTVIYGELVDENKELYDTVVIEQGGTVTTVPVIVDPVTGEAFFGVQMQRRATVGLVWPEFPGGFIDKSDHGSVGKAAAREAGEEAGHPLDPENRLATIQMYRDQFLHNVLIRPKKGADTQGTNVDIAVLNPDKFQKYKDEEGQTYFLPRQPGGERHDADEQIGGIVFVSAKVIFDSKSPIIFTHPLTLALTKFLPDIFDATVAGMSGSPDGAERCGGLVEKLAKKGITHVLGECSEEELDKMYERSFENGRLPELVMRELLAVNKIT